MKAVLCPVCNGTGMVWGGFESGTVPETPCHGCAEWGSKGWLLIPEQEDSPMPYGDGNDTIAFDTSGPPSHTIYYPTKCWGVEWNA